MSYSRDRDRGSRGVGAIAARDLSSSAKHRRRFARRAMGDSQTECWLMDNAGAYYIRHADGTLTKVPQSIAMQVPQCGSSPGATSGGIVGPRGTKTVLQRATDLLRSIQPTTLYSSGTPTEPAPVSSGITTYPGQATSPTPPPTAPTQPTQPTVTVTPTPTKPKPISTRPSLTTGTSTSSGWVGANTSPVSVPAFPAPNPDPGPPPPPASSSSSLVDEVKALSTGKKVALVGAGIGLIYLLTRK